MFGIIELVVIVVVVGFIWVCVREVKNTKAAVTRMQDVGGLHVDASFHCAPSGNLLLDRTARKIGLANISFPTHTREPPISFSASTIVAFEDISKITTFLIPTGTLLSLRFSLATPNKMNGDTYIAVHIDIHDKHDVIRLHDELARAGLVFEVQSA